MATDEQQPGQENAAFRDKAMADAVSRPIAYEDFYYLLGRYPYLEFCHIDATHYPTTPARIQVASSGWNIHIYDTLMISSQSALLSLLLSGVDLSFAGEETLLKMEWEAKRHKLRQAMHVDVLNAKGQKSSQNMQAESMGEAKKAGTQRPATDGNAKPAKPTEQVKAVKPVGTIVNQYFNTAFEMVNLAKAANWPGVRLIRGYYPMQRAAWIACENLKIRCTGFDPTAEDRVVETWVKSLAPQTFSRLVKQPSGRR